MFRVEHYGKSRKIEFDKFEIVKINQTHVCNFSQNRFRQFSIVFVIFNRDPSIRQSFVIIIRDPPPDSLAFIRSLVLFVPNLPSESLITIEAVFGSPPHVTISHRQIFIHSLVFYSSRNLPPDSLITFEAVFVSPPRNSFPSLAFIRSLVFIRPVTYPPTR